MADSAKRIGQSVGEKQARSVPNRQRRVLPALAKSVVVLRSKTWLAWRHADSGWSRPRLGPTVATCPCAAQRAGLVSARQRWRVFLADLCRLPRLGPSGGGGVVTFCENRVEWVLAALGAQAAGGVASGIYMNSTADQAAYILAHCEATVAVVAVAPRRPRLVRLDRWPRRIAEGPPPTYPKC